MTKHERIREILFDWRAAIQSDTSGYESGHPTQEAESTDAIADQIMALDDWIPVSDERLPIEQGIDESETYLCWVNRNGFKYAAVLAFDHGNFNDSDQTYKVTHWKPIEPPKPKAEEKEHKPKKEWINYL